MENMPQRLCSIWERLFSMSLDFLKFLPDDLEFPPEGRRSASNENLVIYYLGRPLNQSSTLIYPKFDVWSNRETDHVIGSITMFYDGFYAFSTEKSKILTAEDLQLLYEFVKYINIRVNGE